MKKMFAFVLSALLLFSIAAPACAAEAGNGLIADRVWAGSRDSASYELPDSVAAGSLPVKDSPYALSGQTRHKKGDHSSGWYSREDGVLGAAVTDKDGNVLEALPEVNDVCPDCRKGICSSANLALLRDDTASSPLVSAIVSPISSRLCFIR